MPLSAKQRDVVGLHTGDGREALEVRTAAGDIAWTAIPDSVVYQYRVEDFASPWPDNVGSADMTVNGLSASTFSNGEDSVSGDGTDDYGLADGPQSLPQNETLGVAVTVEATGTSELDPIFGVSDDGSTANNHRLFWVSGQIEYRVSDENDNELQVRTDSSFDDGSPHAVIINKSGNSAADIDIYVDDTTTPASVSILTDNAFDPSTFSQPGELAFWARNNTADGNVIDHWEGDAGIFEFNTETYSEDERNGFVFRRPEVS